MTCRFRYGALLILMAACLFTPLKTASAGYYGNSSSLVDQATVVYRGFIHDPNMQWFRDNVANARGIFIVPQMLRGGFIVGGSGGKGVFLAQDSESGRWSSPAFYSMGSVSFGLQIGADASEIILLVMTERGLNAMLSTNFKLGADVAVAAGPVGASAKAQTADILAFGRSQGLYGGISIEGAAVSPLHAWNEEYYGRPVRLIDILFNLKWQNPQADQLRHMLPHAERRSKPIGR